MRAKEYQLIEQCVENGLAAGWNRAHKHIDTPSMDHVLQQQLQAITSEIAEWFNFPEEGAE